MAHGQCETSSSPSFALRLHVHLGLGLFSSALRLACHVACFAHFSERPPAPGERVLPARPTGKGIRRAVPYRHRGPLTSPFAVVRSGGRRRHA